MSTLTSTPVYRPLLRIIACTAALLLIPFVASLFTQEVTWTASDYVIAAVLLFTTGVAYTIAWRTAKSPVSRGSLVAFITLLLLAVWAHLAVGIF